ncbi:hypothetical protein [Neptuniibacter halophilus]|uniref:hypothetical protein n=1 Tax=Neptuniibacter halophilus TaxID=651666 RepID=UPI00257282B7|nr:hypothetical protein [Neptuniibacter halophilus]
MTTRNKYTALSGGLDLISPPIEMNPERALLALNYELDANGKFVSLEGYSQIGGSTLAGSGDVLGLEVYKGELYGIREDAGAAKLYKNNAGTWSEIAPAAGTMPIGPYELDTATFKALANAQVMMMQCRNSGKPWQYDGTTLSELTNAPAGGRFLKEHSNHLFIGFEAGSVQFSALGDPSDWQTANGAGEFGVSDSLTGFAPLKKALAIACEKSVQILYGTISADFQREYHSGTGVISGTTQSLGGSALFLAEAGLSSLDTIDDFGDFALGNWGERVKPLLDLTATPTCSAILKRKNQYWLFYSDGTALICRWYGGATWGITTAKLPVVVKAACSGVVAGQEEMFIGTDQGDVFQMNSGTSFNGADIQTTLAVAYNHLGNPDIRKRFRRVFLDIQAESTVQISALPQFDYGDNEIARHLVLFKDALAQGGQWGISNWSEFAWGSPIVDRFKIDTIGTATAINFIINTKSALAKPHRIAGYSTHFSARRLKRG